MSAQSYTGKKSPTPEERLNEMYCSGLFKHTHGTIIDVLEQNVQGYFNILDWLEGRVAGLQVFVLRNGERIPFIRGSQTTIYLNEMPVTPGMLNAVSINDIALIKVIRGPFAGSIGSNSAIAVYTLIPQEDEAE